MEVAASEERREKRQRVRGRPFAPGTTGNPKGRAAIRERADELYGIMAADFDHLTATDAVLLRQASLLLARSQRVHRRQDIEAAIRMSSEARRLLSTLRKRDRRQRESETRLLSEYLTATYPGGAAEPRPAREADSHKGVAARSRPATGGRGNTRQRASHAMTSTSDDEDRE
jgi:hypothetical protein